MVARGAPGPIGERMTQVGDDVDVRAIGRQRLQNLAEGEIGAVVRRRPARHGGAVREVDRPEASLRIRGRTQRRDHRVEQRQRKGGARAAQERAA